MFNSKFLNSSFNNKASSASKGTFVKLILSVLSKKGNWACLLKILNKITKQSRLKTVDAVLKLNRFENFKYISFSAINCKRGIEERFNLNFLQSLGLLPTFNSKKILLGLENKPVASSLIFSNLRSVHSLLKLIAIFIELKNKRRGGRVFLVPVPVKSERRRSSIFIHWMKKTIRDQKNTNLQNLILAEFEGLLLKKGKSIDQLLSLEKSIRVNRVFLRKSQIKLV